MEFCHSHSANKGQCIFLDLGNALNRLECLDKVRDGKMTKLYSLLSLQSFKFHVPSYEIPLDMCLKHTDMKSALVVTCNTSLCHTASGYGQSLHKSSTSAHWHGHSPGLHGQPCHNCSSTAPSPSWAPCSPWKYDHSCGSCNKLKVGTDMENMISN